MPANLPRALCGGSFFHNLVACLWHPPLHPWRAGGIRVVSLHLPPPPARRRARGSTRVSFELFLVPCAPFFAQARVCTCSHPATSLCVPGSCLQALRQTSQAWNTEIVDLCRREASPAWRMSQAETARHAFPCVLWCP